MTHRIKKTHYSVLISLQDSMPSRLAARCPGLGATVRSVGLRVLGPVC
ncbi:hypothetical protein Ae717Ps2_6747c [Pseudonocardia sp. Ae717_Ps2]|nr:hypothetical protein Ae717Ps2_6747c [Pseudonocardia sp. Ae717_Ps2]